MKRETLLLTNTLDELIDVSGFRFTVDCECWLERTVDTHHKTEGATITTLDINGVHIWNEDEDESIRVEFDTLRPALRAKLKGKINSELLAQADKSLRWEPYEGDF